MIKKTKYFGNPEMRGIISDQKLIFPSNMFENSVNLSFLNTAGFTLLWKKPIDLSLIT